MKKRILLYGIGIILVLSACSKKDDRGGDFGSVSLLFPENNSECTEGIRISESQSSITFRWEASENSNSYEVNIKDLDTGSTQKIDANTNAVEVVLNANTPYEWFVVSLREGLNSAPKSEVWKFYNAGVGITNYAPFPASAISPTRGGSIPSTTSVTLEWSGSDVDNDIVDFEILFGTATIPTATIGATFQNSIAVNVVSGQTYYWRVITKDNAGNTSQSEIFNFKVL